MTLRAHLVGKPDGYVIRLRCWLLGHKGEVCNDVCCEGRTAWCARCAAPFVGRAA